jgi:hypothetical protein
MNGMYTVKPVGCGRWQSLISRERNCAIGLERFVRFSGGIAELLTPAGLPAVCIMLYAFLKWFLPRNQGVGVVECARIWP